MLAAEELGLPVVIVRRPAGVTTVNDVVRVLAWVLTGD